MRRYIDRFYLSSVNIETPKAQVKEFDITVIYLSKLVHAVTHSLL